MDFKKFAQFILVIGVLVFGYGGWQWVSNQPQDLPQRSEGSRRGMQGLRAHSEDGLIFFGNLLMAEKQEEAKKIMVVGGVILVVGAGVLYSAKSKTKT